jgi:hypothetical protein
MGWGGNAEGTLLVASGDKLIDRGGCDCYEAAGIGRKEFKIRQLL